jgi:alanyl-tRNA synthetase
VQKQETLLWKVSEALTAPVEKLDKTAEKIVKELKEANVEKHRLIKELAEKESTVGQAKTCEATVEVDGIAIVKRDFGEVIDVNRMIQTATEVIKRNEATVTLFYGSDGKTCRLMVMAGETAVQKGINANQIVKEAAPIFGGVER